MLENLCRHAGMPEAPAQRAARTTIALRPHARAQTLDTTHAPATLRMPARAAQRKLFSSSAPCARVLQRPQRVSAPRTLT